MVEKYIYLRKKCILILTVQLAERSVEKHTDPQHWPRDVMFRETLNAGSGLVPQLSITPTL